MLQIYGVYVCNIPCYLRKSGGVKPGSVAPLTTAIIPGHILIGLISKPVKPVSTALEFYT